MPAYNALTVAQLKEKLVERNLPVEGLKQDLINRLKANDEETVAAAPAAVAVETPAATEPVAATPATTETATEPVAETTTEPAPATEQATEESTIPAGPSAPEPKPLPTPEELKKIALDHLNKKLHRANKFGAEQTTIDEINRSINRIEKFGLDLQNPLAIELGIVKRPTQPQQKKKPQQGKKGGNNNRKNNDNRNRVRKGGNNNRRGGRRY